MQEKEGEKEQVLGTACRGALGEATARRDGRGEQRANMTGETGDRTVGREKGKGREGKGRANNKFSARDS